MTGYLLDTNVVLLALADPNRLPARIQAAVKAGPNLLSAIVYWEVVLKSMKGKLDVGDIRTWWIDTVDQLAAVPLPLRAEHVSEIVGLPPIHQDPFDRALIGQAIAEKATLLSIDPDVSRYQSHGLKGLFPKDRPRRRV